MEIGRGEQQILFANLPEASLHYEFQRLKNDQIIKRIWAHDHTVWSNSPGDISNRLGWLHSHRVMAESLPEIHSFTTQVRADSYTRALLLGMGGSSLAPEVFRKIFGVRNGYLDLDVLDSTDPGAVLEKEQSIEPQKTLYIVSTKSGGTVETVSLMKYFYNKAVLSVGEKDAGKHFIAITDPGSGLEKTARDLSFRKIFLNDPDIGGRYSALSYFGLVPAGLIGADLELLLHNAGKMAAAAAISGRSPAEDNTPAWLGVTLGVLGKSGRDKVTLIFSPAIKYFGSWIEQLLAESTGKDGKGLLPVDGETVAAPEVYANDRLFVYFRLDGDKNHDEKVDKLTAAGHPVIRLQLPDKYALGGELFRWMMATAVAGSIMGINPFDQPDVESAKTLARKKVSVYQTNGTLPVFTPDLKVDGIEIYTGYRAENLQQVWHKFMTKASSGDSESKKRSYVAIQAYLKPDSKTDHALQLLRDKIRTSYHMAVTVGYGPRYLHSTGQLHKGDAGNGLFIQLTAEMPEDLPIPDRFTDDRSSISFGILKDAQAHGDWQALTDAGRQVIRFHFDGSVNDSIGKLVAALTGPPH